MKIYCHNVRVWTRDCDKTSDWYWKKRMKRIHELIKEENPDVLCLQELSFPATLYIPKGYRRVGLSASHHIYVKRGIKTRRSWFHFRWNKVEIKLPNTSTWTNLVCVHLHWNEKIFERNMKKINTLIERCNRRGIGTIVCGDFNKGISAIAPYTNLCILFSQIPTFHNPDTGKTGIIDHFLISEELVARVSNKIVIERDDLSDHRPIKLNYDDVFLR